MEVRLAFGSTGLAVELPRDRTFVVAPRHSSAVDDAAAAVRHALRNPHVGPPLRSRVQRGQRVAIAVCDGTRPQPRELMIPVILEELAGTVDLDDIVILVATGTHRANTDAELRAMLGDAVVDAVRVVNHDARDASTLRFVGVLGDDVPVWLNTEWLDADVRITTGFVEPHFFAGFSGGPKLNAPGLAGLETVLTLHDARRIADARATWGVTVGNPVHDDVRAIASAVGVHFCVDVLLNSAKQIVEVFAGDLLATHAQACEAAKVRAMCAVPRLYDVVVTTNSGYPLDQNLYQSVKGMSAGATVVRPGGTIVCAAECRDGFPDHGSYREVLSSQSSPQALLDMIARRPVTVADQWQVQVQARVQTTARVIMHTRGLTDGELATAHLEQTDDVAQTVRDVLAAYGPGAEVCVLPEGPQTIPYVST